MGFPGTLSPGAEKNSKKSRIGKDQKGVHKRGIHDQGDFWKFLSETTVQNAFLLRKSGPFMDTPFVDTPFGPARSKMAIFQVFFGFLDRFRLFFRVFTAQGPRLPGNPFSAFCFRSFLGRGLFVGRTPRGSCKRTPLRRVLRRFSNSKCFLEGFLEGAL